MIRLIITKRNKDRFEAGEIGLRIPYTKPSNHTRIRIDDSISINLMRHIMCRSLSIYILFYYVCTFLQNNVPTKIGNLCHI